MFSDEGKVLPSDENRIVRRSFQHSFHPSAQRMSLPLHDSNFWQGRADEARQMANEVGDFASKSVLIRIAIDFDRLAARASELKHELQTRQRATARSE